MGIFLFNEYTNRNTSKLVGKKLDLFAKCDIKFCTNDWVEREIERENALALKGGLAKLKIGVPPKSEFSSLN